MQTLKNLSQKLSPPPSKFLAPVFAIFSFIGFLDAAFLTIEHFAGRVPPCGIFTGCDTVTTSQYATILGIPVALLGALYYLSILVLTIAYWDSKKPQFLNVASLLTITGFLASAYFIFLQLFVIKALCLYCVISAANSTILFAAALPQNLRLIKARPAAILPQ